MSTEVDPRKLWETLGYYPTGVAVITAVAAGEPMGMVVGTFSSVSVEPPLIGFFPKVGSKSFGVLRTAEAFCVNVLAADQEELCRRITSGGAPGLQGVDWRPGPLGTPILDGAVFWVECTFERIVEAGDHYIVLGLVDDFAVERPMLPLLFFQSGYGRFTPGSFVAAPDPELIQAARTAETVRAEVEALASELAVDCSVLAKIRWDAVQVLAATGGEDAEPVPLGHRQPIVPPLGAVFLVDSDEEEVDAWLRRAPDDSPDRRDRNLALLERVRERGFSVLAAEPAMLERHRAVLTAFETSERLPRQERLVRQATSELTDLYCPDLTPGRTYELASIVVLLPTEAGVPPMALRMERLPASLTTERIESYVERLQRIASGARAASGAPVGRAS